MHLGACWHAMVCFVCILLHTGLLAHRCRSWAAVCIIVCQLRPAANGRQGRLPQRLCDY
jgi:hypothetical protein